MPVKLASDLELPDNAVTQTFAFIARKGAGKSYAASKLTEELLLTGAPVIVIDPVGTWYGLRLTTTGKTSPFTIPVFGGQHGDIPLQADQGKKLGTILVQQNLAAVIDVSGFRKNDRKRFVADFAEELFFQSRTERTPRMLVLEEAQLFAPQHPQKGDERMLGAIEDIVRLGRNYGIGCTMISQRPQSINKEVLNQVEALFVGQLNASHERKAIEAWVMDHKADKKWTDELPSLPVGTMIAWSPQWLKVMRKVKIAKKMTIDASATPELGNKKSFKLAALDVEGLQAALAEPVKDTKTVGAIAAESKDLKAQEAFEQLAAVRAAAARDRQFFVTHLTSLSTELEKVLTALGDLGERIMQHPALADVVFTEADKEILKPVRLVKPTVEPKNFFLNERQELPSTPRPPWPKGHKMGGPKSDFSIAGFEHGLRAGALRMLKVLGSFHPGSMTKAQVARAAKMKVTGGTFSTYWSDLNKSGYIKSIIGNEWLITHEGMQVLGESFQPVPQSFTARVSYWVERLRSGERKLLRQVIDSKQLSREQLAKLVDMEVTGGTFSTYLSTLTRNRLVTKEDGLLKIHPWLLGEE